MKQIVLVSFDQLNRNRGALKTADPKSHEVLFIENLSMLRSRRWHKQRLHFLLTTVEHFAIELEHEGFTVHRVQASSTKEALSKFANPVIASAPTSHASLRTLNELGVEIVENELFLTSREQFGQWAGSQKSLLMESFYRWQRKRLNILMDGNQPVGGAWNFDAENRNPPPKGPHPWPAPLTFTPDEIDLEIAEKIDEFDTFGRFRLGTWGSTRADALKQLEYFLETSLHDFGTYEDAMPSDTWSVNHSLLSPYLNAGLITAGEVVEATLNYAEKNLIPIASLEGFIRQVIGWREYINGIYWLFEENYRELNELRAERTLLPLFEDSSATKMNCLSSIVSDVEERAWAHHIPRLMVLSNMALLAGVSPQEYLDWMRRTFIDAADWVMVPNVIGMGVHADGGRMMTKPYAAGGAYIKRMGRYCSGCPYDPSKRAGDDACPFTTLYWDFLDRHRETFAKNHRISPQLRGLDRLSDLDQLRERAKEVLGGLDTGRI